MIKILTTKQWRELTDRIERLEQILRQTAANADVGKQAITKRISTEVSALRRWQRKTKDQMTEINKKLKKWQYTGK